MSESSESATRTGLLFGVAAYTIWGVVPLYFKAVHEIPPREMLAHRILWSAVILFILLAATNRLQPLLAVFRSRHALGMLALSTLFIATNWYVFIYSVQTNQIMQGSLGYFILPIVNVAIGTLFFNERMRLPQWIALCFATSGVLVLIVLLEIFPWISLTLAFTFSIYGVIRKHAQVDGTVGLTVETLLLFPIALGFLIVWGSEGTLVFGQAGMEVNTLVVLSGLVTSVPLICFAQAVQRLRIVTIGFLQYISPTLAFLIAVLMYGEAFPVEKQVGYGLIWCGVVVFVVDALSSYREGKVEERVEAEVVPLD